MNKFFQFVILFVLLSRTMAVWAGEGMWLPLLLQQLNEKEMKAMGMKMSAEDIYSVNKGSLKDAIVQFGGGCTAEIISAEGLLLTNHHCGRSQIQRHSSLENNYIDDGFWAMNRQQELSNPGLTVMFIVSMADVTTRILAGIDDSMTDKEKQSIIDKNINKVSADYPKETTQDIQIKPFFKGNQFYLFVTETYRDVRLVGAPPGAIGNFGMDTDNWVWPRHCADFSLFRIYADKNNRPADYSPDNVPYKPKHFLPVSMDGIKADDFTLIFGFPGRTDEYLPSNSVEQVMNLKDPARVAIRERALNIMNKYMQQDKAIKIKYISKAAGIANYWKKMKGEMEGLKRTDAVGKKRIYEAEYEKLLAANPVLYAKYKDVLPALQTEVLLGNEWAVPQIYVSELMGTIELLQQASRADKVLKAIAINNTADYEKARKNFLDGQPSFFKNFETKVDEEVFAAIVEMPEEKMAQNYSFPAYESMRPGTNDFKNKVATLYDGTIFLKADALGQLSNATSEQFTNIITTDPAYIFYRQLIDMYQEKISDQSNDSNQKLEELMKEYMQAQLEVFKDKRFYPDANSTLRVTYGKVDGYHPRDAVEYQTQTYLEGVMEKYIPGDYEFDVPQRLIDLYHRKDYGPYADHGKMPVCFIASNHTTGGNSGSPAIDAYGNIIGLNFDRVWEGTMSDLNYDPTICRNIMVDIRYILFIIDKYAGAGHLVNEMTLVYPKTGKGKSKDKAKK